MAEAPVVAEAPKPPPIKRIEALSFGGESGRIPDEYLPAETRRAQARARGLREQRNKDLSDRDILQRERARGRENPYRATEAVQIARRFGAGYFQAENGGIGDGKDATESAKENFNEGEKLVENVGRVALYVDIVAEAQRRGINIDDSREMQRLLEARGSKGSWDDVHDRALNTVVAAVQKAVPELSELEPYAQREFVDAAIARDPELRVKILQGVRAVEQKAAELKDVEEDPEIKQLKEQKGVTAEAKKQALAKIESGLKDIGITVDDQIKKGITDAIEQGRSVDYVIGGLRRSLFTEAQFGPGLKECQEWDAVNEEMAAITKWSSENVIVGKEGKRTPRVGGDAGLEEKDKRYQDLQKKSEELNRAFKNNPALSESYQRYKALQQALGQPGEQGQYAGMVRANVADIIKAQAELKNADEKIAEKEPASKRKHENSLDERLRSESELLSELSGVVEDAVSDVLLDRYDEMTRLDHARLDQLAETKAKAGEELTAESIRKLQKKIDGNWVSYDEKSRQRKVNRGQIGKDMRYAAYHGEEGIKRLILRDLGMSLVTADSSGNIINSKANWETVDLSSLSKEGRELLDKAYESCGGTYRDRLFSDYFIARTGMAGGLSATIRSGNLNMRNHELELLNRNFGESFEAKLNSSKEGQEMLKAMKEKGLVPSSKTKWLIYLLTLLGVGAGAILGGPLGAAITTTGGARLIGGTR